jgi:hypothetical protein
VNNDVADYFVDWPWPETTRLALQPYIGCARTGDGVNELTVDKLGEAIKQLIRHEANQDGGPSLDREVLVSGLIRDADLKRVLDVKGELVIRIKAVPEALVGTDADPCGMEDPEDYTDGMKSLKQLAAAASARCTEAPLNVD